MGKRPYLSIITPCRNDNYAGGNISKLQFTLDLMLTQLDHFKIESEYVLVDWNPPDDTPRIKDVVKPKESAYCSVRIIEVEPDIHKRYDYWKNRNIHATVSVNAGFRKARGYFTVTKGADVIWAHELFSFIALKKLDKKFLYQAIRKDTEIHASALDLRNPDCVQKYLENNIVAIHKSTYSNTNLPFLHTNACGDFQLMSREVFWKLHGYMETSDVSTFAADGIMAYCANAAGFSQQLLPDNMCVFKIRHDNQFNSVFRPRSLRNNPLSALLFLCLGRLILSLGLRCFLKKRFILVYRLLFGSISEKYYNIPVLPYSYYFRLYQRIINRKESCVMNNENWGLKNEDLLDVWIHKANWDK